MYVLPVLALLASGLHGVVLRGPTKPVCTVGVPCSSPAVGVVLVFSHAGGAAGRVRTGSGGRYSIRLAPGLYTVTVVPQPRIGAGIQPRTVRVRRGVDARQSFTIDTGIR